MNDKELKEQIRNEIRSFQDLKNEVQKIYSEQQIKYTYYLIALSIGAIVLSINQTINEAFTYNKIALGIAFICWITSVVLGLKWLKNNIIFTDENIIELDNKINLFMHILKNKDYSKLNDKDVEANFEAMKLRLDEEMDLAKYQVRFFYIGMFSFLVYYILEVYQNTVC